MQGKPGLTAGVWSILDFVNGFPASLEREGVRSSNHGSALGAGSNTWLVGRSDAHPKIGRRALVGTARANAKAKAKISKKGKVKNINPSFLPPNVCLDNADLFIHG
jgi:hypothetical protein